MAIIKNLPMKYRLFTREGEEKHVVYSHAQRITLPEEEGLQYTHVEVGTHNLINHGWTWESEGDFIAHEEIRTDEETDQTV